MNQAERKRRQIEMVAAVIGLINILIFGNIVGNNGIAYLTIAYAGFSLLNTLLSGGVSESLGKMLRVRNGKGQYRNVLCIRKRVLMLQGILGAFGSILFAACAGRIAQRLFGVQYAAFIILLLAPTVFLRTISAVLIGFFQGEGTELPGAVAAFLRQILLLGLGLLFAHIFSQYGSKVSALLGVDAYTAMYGSAGIAVAMLLTEVFVLAFLGVVLLGSRRTVQEKQREGMKQTDSWLDTMKILYGAMWFPQVFRFMEILPVWVGVLFYGKSMVDSTAFVENLGMLSGKYFVICGIVVLVICMLVFPVNTKLIGALKKDDIRSAKVIFQSGLHIGVVNGIFASVFMTVTAKWLGGMYGGSETGILTDMFQFGAAAILFAVLFFYFSRLLLFTGKKYYLLGAVAVAELIFVLLASLLLNTGKVGILSLIYAGIAAMGIGSLLLGFVCCRLLHVGVEWLQIIVIPAGVASVVGLLVMLLGKVIFQLAGNAITVFVCLVLALLLYWGAILLLRNFREQELKCIPFGKIILAVGQRLHIF